MQPDSKIELSSNTWIGQTLFRKITPDEILRWKDQFRSNGVVIFDDLVLKASFDELSRETVRMLDFSKRKDLKIESVTSTERKMSTVGGNLLKMNSRVLADLYRCTEIIDFLMSITGDEVYTVPDMNEDIVINCLHRKKDIHGRHIDTYSFAFNLMILAPPQGSGGELAIYEGAEIRKFEIATASFYLIRTDKYEHEVLNLTQDVQRLVINMSYCNKETKDLYSYSSDLLYS